MATASPPKIIPHLCVRGVDAAIAFYEKAFGAKCEMRMPAKDGIRIMHAQLALFGGTVMMHDEFPESSHTVLSPATRGGTTVAININLAGPKDVDAAIAKAATAGAKAIMPAGDMFWGSRYGRVEDPFGHVWAFNAPLGKMSESKSA